MGYVDKGIKKALEIARTSDCPNYLIGAVLMKRNKFIKAASNRFKKSHPQSKTIHNGIHAEFNCLIGLDPEKCKNCVLFVARVTPSGTVSMARPCEHCFELLREYNIRAFYYTNYEGEVVKEMVVQ